MVLTHAAMMRRRVAQGAPFVSSGLFLAGYLVAWSGFSAVAALTQSAAADKDALVAAADSALYRAKRLGKNRVVRAG